MILIKSKHNLIIFYQVLQDLLFCRRSNFTLLDIKLITLACLELFYLDEVYFIFFLFWGYELQIAIIFLIIGSYVTDRLI